MSFIKLDDPDVPLATPDQQSIGILTYRPGSPAALGQTSSGTNSSPIILISASGADCESDQSITTISFKGHDLVSRLSAISGSSPSTAATSATLAVLSQLSSTSALPFLVAQNSSCQLLHVDLSHQ